MFKVWYLGQEYFAQVFNDGVTLYNLSDGSTFKHITKSRIVVSEL